MDSAELWYTPQAGRLSIPDVAGPNTLARAYRAWGWPVSVCGDQVWMNLDQQPDSGLGVDAVAVMIPAGLADQAAEVLTGRRCPPAMLGHPALASHRVIVAGECFGVPLGWPDGVHLLTGTLLLPPTPTAHGPLRWVLPPEPLALTLCREVDVRAALDTLLRRPLADKSEPA